MLQGSVGKMFFFCFMSIHTDTDSSHFKQAACTINNMNPTEKSSFHYVVLKSRQYFCCVFSVTCFLDYCLEIYCGYMWESLISLKGGHLRERGGYLLLVTSGLPHKY